MKHIYLLIITCFMIQISLCGCMNNDQHNKTISDDPNNLNDIDNSSDVISDNNNSSENGSENEGNVSIMISFMPINSNEYYIIIPAVLGDMNNYFINALKNVSQINIVNTTYGLAYNISSNRRIDIELNLTPYTWMEYCNFSLIFNSTREYGYYYLFSTIEGNVDYQYELNAYTLWISYHIVSDVKIGWQKVYGIHVYGEE